MTEDFPFAFSAFINNDNVVSDPFDPTNPPNFAAYTVTSLGLEPVDVELDVLASAGTTEYDIGVLSINLSGTEWFGYSYELGFGTGDDFVAASTLYPSADAPNLNAPTIDFDFGSPGQDSASPVDLPQFPVSVWEADRIVVSTTDTPNGLGSGVNAPVSGGGGSFFGLYALDVPDADFVPASALTPSGYRLTVRHTPLLAPLTTNGEPVLDDASMAVTHGETVSHTFTGSDPDGDPLTWELLSLEGPGVGVSPTFDPLTQAFLWDTTGSTPGTYLALASASDPSGAQDVSQLVIQVRDVIASEVPEPSSLLLGGAVLMAFASRRRTLPG